MAKDALFGHTMRTDVLNEANIIKMLCHENIINLIDVIDSTLGALLIFPLMQSTLYDEIYEKNASLDLVELSFQLLKGIEHMHSKNVMHRDLKPCNILVNDYSCIKICDFGISTTYKENERFMIILGTYRYLAPEVLLKFGYKNSVDIWIRYLAYKRDMVFPMICFTRSFFYFSQLVAF